VGARRAACERSCADLGRTQAKENQRQEIRHEAAKARFMPDAI
jgi:hypothetical protein